VRGRGAMLAIEFVRPGTDEPAADVAAAVARYCHANGVLVLTCGTYGNVFRLLPPLVIGFDLLDDAIAVIAEGVAKAEAVHAAA
jgi:4-aminobutyrate aminotransferase/(S)-3-amino-2-methylpropionate transaminase